MPRKSASTRIWRGLQKVAALMDLPGKLHSHTARHTLATHTVEVTGDMRLAQHLLGHKSLGMTEQYVRTMMPSTLDKGVSQVYSRARNTTKPPDDTQGGTVVPMWKGDNAA